MRRFTILNLGAGVQSTALYLMAAKGELTPKPEIAIFADTGWEPDEVYEHFGWLRSIQGEAGIPIELVSNGNIREDIIASTKGGRVANPPFFTVLRRETRSVKDVDFIFDEDYAGRYGELFAPVDAKSGSILTDDELAQRQKEGDIIRVSEDKGMLRRSCTTEYKIEPIRAFIRTLTYPSELRSILSSGDLRPDLRSFVERMGEEWVTTWIHSSEMREQYKELVSIKWYLDRPKHIEVEQWFGITTDEAQRAKVSDKSWTTFRYPLLEIKMSREQCIEWLLDNGYPEPPKSACVGCPYRDNGNWRAIRNNPSAWKDAVYIDNLIRSGIRGTEGTLYLHQHCVPLEEVDLLSDDDTVSMLDECDGMCGL